MPGWRALCLAPCAAWLAACDTPPAKHVPPPELPPTVSVARMYERPAEHALVTGMQQYDAGALDQAEASFRSALNSGLQDRRDTAVAFKYLAFIACAFNRLQECEQNFHSALANDPDFRLSESEIGHPVWGPVYRRIIATLPPPPTPPKAPTSQRSAF